jgi:hypothetical protein
MLESSTFITSVPGVPRFDGGRPPISPIDPLDKLVKDISEKVKKVEESDSDSSNIDSDSDSESDNETEVVKVSFLNRLKCVYMKNNNLPYYVQVYKSLPSIMSASIVSMHLGEINVQNVAITTSAYAAGDKLFPVIVTSYMMSYLYENYLYDKF